MVLGKPWLFSGRYIDEWVNDCPELLLFTDVCVSILLILFTLFTYDASSGLFTISTLLPELVSLFLKNDKIDFKISQLK